MEKEKNIGNVPECVGFIMDGNRTWAKSKGLPAVEGYRKGADKLKEVLYWSLDLGVRNEIVYAFSTENWNRPAFEVDYLMKLTSEYFKKNIEELCTMGVRVKFIGNREKFSDSVLKTIEST